MRSNIKEYFTVYNKNFQVLVKFDQVTFNIQEIAKKY